MSQKAIFICVKSSGSDLFFYSLYTQPFKLCKRSTVTDYHFYPSLLVLFDRKSLLRHVMSLHKREDCPFVCPIEFCQKKFSIHAILIRHMAKVHKNQNKASIQCNLCTKVFHHDLLLQDHVKKKHQIIPPPLMPINDNKEENVFLTSEKIDNKEEKVFLTSEKIDNKEGKVFHTSDKVELTEEKRKIICDQCSRPFSDTDLLNR